MVMKRKRRRLRGKSVLVASGSAMILGCSGGGDVGNTAPPPPATLCVDSEPPTAEVLVDGFELGEDGCTTIYSQGFGGPEPAWVTATADGYEPYEESVNVTSGGTTNHSVVMTEEDEQTP